MKFIQWKCFIIVGSILVSFPAGAEVLSMTATTPTFTTNHGDPELQQKRLAFIKNAIAVGLLAGIEDTGPITRVTVGKKFISLPFQEKEDIINMVWAYYKTNDPQRDVVLIIDRKNGKELGEYSLANGGLKMK